MIADGRDPVIASITFPFPRCLRVLASSTHGAGLMCIRASFLHNFGVATVVFPLFVLQPALGLGIASSKTSKPAQARLKSLATHVVFGVGLYLCAVLLNQ